MGVKPGVLCPASRPCSILLQKTILKVKRNQDKGMLAHAESTLAPTSSSLEHLTGKGQEPGLTYHSRQAAAGPRVPPFSSESGSEHAPPLPFPRSWVGKQVWCGAAG